MFDFAKRRNAQRSIDLTNLKNNGGGGIRLMKSFFL